MEAARAPLPGQSGGLGLPVCEVLLGRDIRAPEVLSLRTTPKRYLRRHASIAFLFAVDFFAAGMALSVTQRILEPPGGGLLHHRILALASVVAILVVALGVQGLFGVRERRRNRGRIGRAAVSTLLAGLVLQRLSGLWTSEAVVLAWAVGTLVALSGRMLYDCLLRRVFDLDPDTKRVILLGSAGACAAFLESPGVDGLLASNIHVLGAVGESTVPGSARDWSGLPRLGPLDDLESIVRRECPDELVVVERRVERERLVELAGLCRRRRLNLKLSNLDLRLSRTSISLLPSVGETLFAKRPRANHPVAWSMKRAADVATAAALLVLTAPFLAAIAAAIKLTSPGPIFFMDERVGLGQRVFRCYKFRTMRADAQVLQAELEAQNEADGAIFKLRRDPRVTGFGRVLRKLSIDELPQLLNVLRGEMSLVGPRPLPLRDNTLLDAEDKRRHLVLPGITGLWQVSGRSDMSFEDMIRLDCDYIDMWSLGLDVSIAVRTFGAVFASRGAY